jgi:hypothetical protein
MPPYLCKTLRWSWPIPLILAGFKVWSMWSESSSPGLGRIAEDMSLIWDIVFYVAVAGVISFLLYLVHKRLEKAGQCTC